MDRKKSIRFLRRGTIMKLDGNFDHSDIRNRVLQNHHVTALRAQKHIENAKSINLKAHHTVTKSQSMYDEINPSM